MTDRVLIDRWYSRAEYVEAVLSDEARLRRALHVLGGQGFHDLSLVPGWLEAVWDEGDWFTVGVVFGCEVQPG